MTFSGQFEKYVIRRVNAANGVVQETAIADPNANEYLIEDMVPFSRYKVSVAACTHPDDLGKGGGCSDASGGDIVETWPGG